ncbi:MAG: 16S rRNA (cytidine(1402)-2'-O)-methyltransferase [Pseudomonadota bacterium]
MQDSPQPSPPGTLAIVATPIGNLRDITLRALDVLRQADLIAAEDTRNSQHLLGAYGIQGKLVAVHEHNEAAAATRIVADLQAGKRVAYISDAGTPGLSDPGARLVQAVRAAGLPVLPVPGASALAAAVSVSGIEGPFLFHGFLPPKAAARRKVLEGLRDLPAALVFYEAPHRIEETVADLAAVLGEARTVLFARELTKRFEQLHACPLGEATAWLAADDNHRRGEFVLVVAPPAPAAEDGGQDARRVLEVLLAELPVKQAAQLAAKLTGARKNELYDLALGLKNESKP